MPSAIRILACLLLIQTVITTGTVAAADPDPVSLVGEWVGSQRADRDPQSKVTGMFYFTIKAVEKDGTYQGVYYYACARGCSPLIANHDQPITGKIVADGDKMNVSFHYDAGSGYFYKLKVEAVGDVMTGITEGRLGVGQITLTRKK